MDNFEPWSTEGEDAPVCDHCGMEMHRGGPGLYGLWVDEAGSHECPAVRCGHEVDGEPS